MKKIMSLLILLLLFFTGCNSESTNYKIIEVPFENTDSELKFGSSKHYDKYLAVTDILSDINYIPCDEVAYYYFPKTIYKAYKWNEYPDYLDFNLTLYCEKLTTCNVYAQVFEINKDITNDLDNLVLTEPSIIVTDQILSVKIKLVLNDLNIVEFIIKPNNNEITQTEIDMAISYIEESVNNFIILKGKN